MPDPSLTPKRKTIKNLNNIPQSTGQSPYVELGLVSCFSFLRGASEASDLVLSALQHRYDAIGIADHNTLAGVVRLHSEAKEANIRPVIGCRLNFVDAPSYIAYPKTRAAYGRLSRLLSRGKMRRLDGEWQDKAECHLTLRMLLDDCADLQLIIIPPDDLDKPQYDASFVTQTLQDAKPSYLQLVGDNQKLSFEKILPILAQTPELNHIAASYIYKGDDIARISRLDHIAKEHALSILATNDVHYHAPERRPLQDIITCIREKVTLPNAGYLLHPNAERYLKSPSEMIRLFAAWPHAIAASRAIADACNFSLDELKYEYPEDPIPDGHDPQQWLIKVTWQGAEKRYPDGVPDKVRAIIEKELVLIEKLDIARYFLTIKDIIDFARSCDPPILCQGRGSAANSAVCYCLEITGVNPAEHELLIERFISEDRDEPPDIDVDFEHERREDVIQYIYQRYGRERAGLCATVIHYRPRSAIREVGKVMGLSEDITSALAGTVWGSYAKEIEQNRVNEAGIDLTDPHLRRTLILAKQLIGMPRHLSQHVGGFILTEGPLIETVPIGNGAMADRTFIEWDKDDIDALGILKVDVLALGMLSCIRKSFGMIDAHYNKQYDLANVPREIPAVYDMLCKADSIGVFQVESRAQMNMLPRLKPRRFYDLVIEVAIVRPGPIQGDMVHPYLKRRSGKEVVAYPSPSPSHGPENELRSILERTLGVPIFQEQAMKIALDAAKFSGAEANKLRKAMATFRSRGMVDSHQDMMISRMTKRGYEEDFARRCFDQIKGFGEYGFPESHAASFAHLVYISSWLKCFYPDVFCAALLNSQPMGFYAPAQLVRDARDHGVEVRGADANYSDWDCTLEPIGPNKYALRLGFRLISGLRKEDAYRIMERRTAPFENIEQMKERTGLSTATLERIASADGYRSMGLDRRQALWDVRALKSAPDLPLFAFTKDEGEEMTPIILPPMPLSEHVVSDYQTMRLSLKAHPLQFLRTHYNSSGFTMASRLGTVKNGRRVLLSGVVLIRQKPGSAKGVCFITLEDESGTANLVIWPNKMQEFRSVIMGARLIEVDGIVQMDENVIHIVANRLIDASWRLAELSDDMLRPAHARADHVRNPLPSSVGAKKTPNMRKTQGPNVRGHPRNHRILPRSRDFH